LETEISDWHGTDRFLAALDTALGNVKPGHLHTEEFENGGVCRSGDTRGEWGEIHFNRTDWPDGARDGNLIKTRSADGRQAGLNVFTDAQRGHRNATHWNDLGPGPNETAERMLTGIEEWAPAVDRQAAAG